MSMKQNSNPPVLHESRHEGACKRCGSYVTATAWSVKGGDRDLSGFKKRWLK